MQAHVLSNEVNDSRAEATRSSAEAHATAQVATVRQDAALESRHALVTASRAAAITGADDAQVKQRARQSAPLAADP